MKKLRKVSSTKRKQQRKEATEQLAARTSLMMNHPKECSVCADPFERNHTTVKTWHIVVREEKVYLTCPPCWDRIQQKVTNDE